METTINVNSGENYGIIGGKFNSINNYIQTYPSMFSNASSENEKGMSFGAKNILRLMLFNEFSEEIAKTIENGKKEGRNPIKIKVTNVVKYCAETFYHNNSNCEKEVWNMVDELIILLAQLTFAYTNDCYIRHVRVMDEHFYEIAYNK